jgi:hypothetical protein
VDVSNKRFATTSEEEITAKKLKMCAEKTLKQNEATILKGYLRQKKMDKLHS